MLYLNKYRTDSIRLKGWDYRWTGAYFVTICTKSRQHFFGKIQNGVMGLSHMGIIANWYWLQIPGQFPHVEIDEYVVMPNHVHGIIWIKNNRRRGAINRAPTSGGVDKTKKQTEKTIPKQTGGITGQYNPMNSGGNLGQIIRWYKGRCSFEIHRRNYSRFAWQRRYWDHIIRNRQSLNRIRKYIVENPSKWNADRFYN